MFYQDFPVPSGKMKLGGWNFFFLATWITLWWVLTYFEYQFDQLLSQIAYSMIVNRQAYYELVLWYDENGIVQGITFEEIKVVAHFVGSKYIYFLSKVGPEKKWMKYRIPNNHVIRFSMRELDFPRGYFHRLMKQLNKIDCLLMMELDPKETPQGFSFQEYLNKKDYLLLKLPSRIGWLGRNYDNKYLGECYLLHRKARLMEFRRRLLQYMLRKLNTAIQLCSQELECNGRIVVNCQFPAMGQLFDQLDKGHLSVSELFDVLQKE